ncbi:MAG: DUF4116 domain-containing protein [Candidatus Magasanikbacteria bacterium]|jgi:hypothetical protein|nr:DUF4116 domain-containing protein [Candidatus Magasanikbacteria bacterium]MBT4220687.1 DUF4116 domain-containing protein [Candidatus Magasanikbacteria bacterium]MBT4350365.1 DUF4116 domain-containing protein [Candidatus Magasanikbacteria bacterium]MBT4541757.1 DUF4116 domain-containing protein [Candidatus Magasanikbacteria bacterium]MBT6252775.1 DUF4116 domain-containing protein [Candidatus Magasanikbacteria bacterium]
MNVAPRKPDGLPKSPPDLFQMVDNQPSMKIIPPTESTPDLFDTVDSHAQEVSAFAEAINFSDQQKKSIVDNTLSSHFIVKAIETGYMPIRNIGFILDHYPHDRNIALSAARHSDIALHNMSEEMKRDEEIIDIALTRQPKQLECTSVDVQIRYAEKDPIGHVNSLSRDGLARFISLHPFYIIYTIQGAVDELLEREDIDSNAILSQTAADLLAYPEHIPRVSLRLCQMLSKIIENFDPTSLSSQQQLSIPLLEARRQGRMSGVVEKMTKKNELEEKIFNNDTPEPVSHHTPTKKYMEEFSPMDQESVLSS